MAAILEVRDLRKEYPKFSLGPVSFSVEEGSIMGFIGRNGAGKTTTIKSILNVVHPLSGEIRYFGLELLAHERDIKQRIGYAGGAVDYYPRKKISRILEVTSRFYKNWDWDANRRYLDMFSVDPEKTPRELSEGMKVKLNLAMALSHRAELLILDEPSSGLDPVSREELMDIFRYLRDQGVAILFSTHITSDLEKCADHITYIRQGQLMASCGLPEFVEDNKKRGKGGSLDEIMMAYEKEVYLEKLTD